LEQDALEGIGVHGLDQVGVEADLLAAPQEPLDGAKAPGTQGEVGCIWKCWPMKVSVSVGAS
jgi:hypothetical protein